MKVTIEPNLYEVKYDAEIIMSLLRQDDYQKVIPELIADKDTDTLYFVDFLTQSQELVHFGDEYLEWLRDFRVAIVNGLNRYSSVSSEESGMKKATKDGVFKKYRWLLEYWNSVVEDDNAAFPVPDIDKENQRKFREMYKELKIRKMYPYR